MRGLAPDDNPTWTGYARSHDGGRSWAFSTFHGYAGDTEMHLPSLPFYGAASLRDPIVQFLNDGSVVVAGLILRAESVDLYAAHIPHDAMQPDAVTLPMRGGLRGAPGASGLPPIIDDVPVPIGVLFNDGPHMGADPSGPGIAIGSVAESVADPDGAVATPYVVTSQDGITWSDAVFLTDEGRIADPDGSSFSSPRPLYDVDGRLHAFVRDLVEEVMLDWVSTDGGATWEGPATLITGLANVPDGGFWANANPDPQVDRSDGPRRGTLYVTWSDTRNGDRDVFVVRSSEGGSSWSEPVRVNDDPVGNGRAQFFPYLSVHPETGDLAFLFYDRRADPDDVEAIATMAYSSDGGDSLVNVAVAAEPTSAGRASNDPPNGLVPILTGIADYIDITHNRDGFVSVWADSRDATDDRPFSQIYVCVATPEDLVAAVPAPQG